MCQYQNANSPANPNATPLITSYLTDALGSTIRLTTDTGAIQTEYRYEPYGATTQITSSNQPQSDNPYQYTGRENDQTPLGLYHYRYRYYSTKLNRFISEDPIEYTAGPNLFGYVGGDPASYTDPLGTNPAAGALAGAEIGAALGQQLLWLGR